MKKGGVPRPGTPDFRKDKSSLLLCSHALYTSLRPAHSLSRPPYKPPPPTNRHPTKRIASIRVYLQNKFLKIQFLINCNPSFYSAFLFIQWIDILKLISRMHLRI